jgi:hypothetical protein
MPKEHKSSDDSSLPPESRPFDSEDTEHDRGFRHWMAENEVSLRVLLLIAAYACLMLDLVFYVLLGGPSLITKILTGIIVGSLVGAYALFRLGFADEEGRTVWQVYRAPRTERVEKWIAIALWTLIVIGVLLALFVFRLHRG